MNTKYQQPAEYFLGTLKASKQRESFQVNTSSISTSPVTEVYSIFNSRVSYSQVLVSNHEQIQELYILSGEVPLGPV